ncbi:MAG: hypothetical protein U0894_05785 [Pirellulales bacterium]
MELPLLAAKMLVYALAAAAESRLAQPAAASIRSFSGPLPQPALLQSSLGSFVIDGN